MRAMIGCDPLAYRPMQFFAVDILNGSLYSATPLQVVQHSLERNTALAHPQIERFEIFGVPSQRQPHRVIDDV